jgi:hypothetical protein
MASKSPAIMRMIIALSASELHALKRPSVVSGLPLTENHGAHNYNIALEELSPTLDPADQKYADGDLEIHLACLFFMAHYELKFGYSHDHLRLHLQGVRALLESYNSFLLDGTSCTGPREKSVTERILRTCSGISPLSAQLLLFIALVNLARHERVWKLTFLTGISAL